MLVLSREPTESIHIRDDIVLTVLEILGDRVRLGIAAPRDVSVYCNEVHEAIAGLRPRHHSCALVIPSPLMTAPSAMAIQATALLPATTPRASTLLTPVRAGPCESE